MRKLVVYVGFFVICGLVLFFMQGLICFGGVCNPLGSSSTNGAGLSGEVLSPGNTPANGGVAYVPISYEEEKANQETTHISEFVDSSGSGSSGESGESSAPIVSALVISSTESNVEKADTAAGKPNSGTVGSLPIKEEDCYGAEACNPTGNPIGGGAGYSRIITQTDSRVKYVVSTKNQLLSALSSAQSGEVVFVKRGAVIDMNGTANVVIPAGVTLASDRGYKGSPGALIKKSINTTNGYCETLFTAKEGVRVTGLQLEGEKYPKYAEWMPTRNYLVGVWAQKGALEVDNCEIRGWSWAGVMSGYGTGGNTANIHHNHIHHDIATYEGYGVEVYGGNALIEANLFETNRHSIMGSGVTGESYEARYNIELGNGYDGEQHFDIHAGTGGYSYSIHHNTFLNETYRDYSGFDIKYRGTEPELGVWIDHNIFNWDTSWNTRPVFSYALAAGQSKTYVTDNMVGIPPTTLKHDGMGVIEFSFD